MFYFNILFIFLLLVCVYYILFSLAQYDDEEVEKFIFNIPYIFYLYTLLSYIYIYIYNLNRLIIIHNKYIIAIFNISNICNTNKYYKILDILKFNDIIK